MIVQVALGIVALMVLGACGGEDGGERPDSSDQPEIGVINETLDGIWASTGVDISQVSFGDYRFRFEPTSTDCAELETDDRWLGERMSSAPPGLREQQAIEEAISAHLEDEGFTVEHLRRTNPAALTRALDAVRDTTRVFVTLAGDGYTSVSVQSGPCAPTYGTYSEQFEPDT